jgi:hypothetical protein
MNRLEWTAEVPFGDPIPEPYHLTAEEVRGLVWSTIESLSADQETSGAEQTHMDEERELALRLAAKNEMVAKAYEATAEEVIARACLYLDFLRGTTADASADLSPTSGSQGIPSEPFDPFEACRTSSEGAPQTLGERLLATHLKFERCKRLGLPWPEWSDL